MVAAGREALVEGMAAYFEEYPTVRSELVAPAVYGARVVGLERVHWEREGREMQQHSLAVWELRGGLVARVWYFPAER